jgi:hypothetical protein
LFQTWTPLPGSQQNTSNLTVGGWLKFFPAMNNSRLALFRSAVTANALEYRHTKVGHNDRY